MYLAGPVAERLLTPSGTVIALVSRFPGELLYILTLIVVVTVLGIAWGVLYGGFEDRVAPSLPDWQHGLLFAVFPLAMSLLAVVPVVVSSGAVAASRWLAAAAAEAVLWGIYGTLLGLTYPIFNAHVQGNHDAGGSKQAHSDDRA